MAVRPIDGNKLIEWFSPYLHTGEPIPADVVIEDIRSMPTLTPPNEWVSVEEKQEAIRTILGAATLNSMTKQDLLRVMRWMWEQRFAK